MKRKVTHDPPDTLTVYSLDGTKKINIPLSQVKGKKCEEVVTAHVC